MLLIVIYFDGIMLVQMTLYTDDSVTTIRDDVMSLSVLCMSGAMNNVLSHGNRMNANNTSTSFSSLSVAAAAVAVVYPMVLHTYSI